MFRSTAISCGSRKQMYDLFAEDHKKLLMRFPTHKMAIKRRQFDRNFRHRSPARDMDKIDRDERVVYDVSVNSE
ncbi:hypothetical protein TNCV_1490061 [Trichonephila clavipes]|nr:hypothetical protein TNCV_1490061 [Trichonephila clavipes]